MTTISASTTTTTAYKVAADTTGTLVLQTGSGPTTAVTIGTTQNVTVAGSLTATTLTATNGIVLNSQTVATSVSIPSGYSAMSSGPVTVATGQSVTIPGGSRWVIV